MSQYTYTCSCGAPLTVDAMNDDQAVSMLVAANDAHLKSAAPGSHNAWPEGTDMTLVIRQGMTKASSATPAQPEPAQPMSPAPNMGEATQTPPAMPDAASQTPMPNAETQAPAPQVTPASGAVPTPGVTPAEGSTDDSTGTPTA